MITAMMDQILLAALPPVWASACGSALLGVLGAALSMGARRWFQDRAPIVSAFAAAVLVSAAVLHLLPEALAHVPMAPALIALGLFIGLSFDVMSRFSVSRAGGGAVIATLAPVLAIAVHAFADGVAQASAFAFSPFTGVVTTPGIAFHKLPEGAVAFALVYAAGGRVFTAFAVAVAASALTTLLGVAVARPILSEFGPSVSPYVFAVAAGLLLYVGGANAAPSVRKVGLAASVAAFAAGVVLSVTVLNITGAHMGHSHGGMSLQQAFFPVPARN